MLPPSWVSLGLHRRQALYFELHTYLSRLSALGITGLVFFGKLSKDERSAALAQYKSAIDAWDGKLASSFITPPPRRNYTLVITPISPNMALSGGSYALPASRQANPFSDHDPEGGIPTSSTYASYYAGITTSYSLSGSLASTVKVRWAARVAFSTCITRSLLYCAAVFIRWRYHGISCHGILGRCLEAVDLPAVVQPFLQRLGQLADMYDDVQMRRRQPQQRRRHLLSMVPAPRDLRRRRHVLLQQLARRRQ